MPSELTRILVNQGPTADNGVPALAFAEPGISTDQNFLIIGTGTNNPHLVQTTHSTIVIDYSETPGVIQRRYLARELSTPAAPAYQTNRKGSQPSGICEPTDGDVGIVVKGVLIGRFHPTGLTLSGALTYTADGGVILSAGTTVQRPSAPIPHGFIWHNKTLDQLEWWDADAQEWRDDLGSGGSGSGLMPWETITANYTAQAGQRLICNTDGGSFILTLPLNPPDKTELWVIGDFAARPLTVARNGKAIGRKNEDFTLNKDNIGAKFVFDISIDSWRVWP